VNDLFRELGPLVLASRLRRLSDRLYRDISRLYRELDLDMEARWFPIIYVLSDGEPASVTEIAARIGMTHPAVHQIVNAMGRAGLVDSQTDDQDQRRRLLRLTPKGDRTVRDLQPLWSRIDSEIDTLIRDSGGTLLDSVERIERSLDEKEFLERMRPGLESRN